MYRTFLTFRGVASFFLLLLSGTSPIQAATCSDVKLLVGYSPGGSVDLVARAIAPQLAKRLGQTVTVQNIAGASGALAAVSVALAEPDGCTLLLGSPAEVGINHLTSRRLKYDPLKDTTPILLIGSQPMVLVASRKVPVANVDEFLKYVNSAAVTPRIGSSGMGTPLHLAAETIKQRSGVRLNHVPYRGAGVMLPDLMSGQLPFAIMVLSSALPQIGSGSFKALGLTELRSAAAASNIPPLGKHPQLEGLDLGVWFGLFGPAKLPSGITDKLRDEVRLLLKEPELRRQLESAGLALQEDVELTPFLKAEIQKFRRIVELADIQM